MHGWLTDWRIRTSFKTDVELKFFHFKRPLNKGSCHRELCWSSFDRNKVRTKPGPSVECGGSGLLADDLDGDPGRKEE